MFSFDTKREPEKCQRFRRAGATKKGLLALLTPKRRATPEKTEDSRLFGVKIFNRFFRLRRFEAPQSLRDSSPEGEQALARRAALSQKAALQMPFAPLRPLP